MKNLFLLFAVVLVLFASCSSGSEKPENLLSKETMIQVMADMQLAEAKVKNIRVSTDSARHVYSIYELQILDAHGIDPEQYKSSYQYYLDSYDEMAEIHTALIDTLNQRQSQIVKSK